ncbi:hypothetical protein BFF93_15355 [Elizabethkingia meningoseptica]|uniref:hypothetical protein n=1 Tax=Elizabethkingia meningoseptica TaxID=238 RepID=UPI0008419804|nr:hypothetical protein [Elizabethkingia meningoseptica]ODM52281.1 hypothetical protein BES09_16020 [Elizabethkingia meningoseptica]OHT26918.1 hypothetical protein BFF93_15355 [Elizabethkingia meningoseptica]
MTTQDEIEKVHGSGTHVLLLGAGASFASTLKNPEKNEKKLPLMWNIVDIVGLNGIVDHLPDDYKALKQDFEKLYSKISNEGRFPDEKEVIELEVYKYFEQLDLPNEPTIYDYMILALRSRKDVIATFNWDPFLYKAYVRNGKFTKSPGILFLHGCVSLGFDKSNGTIGPAGMYSKKTEQLFEPTQLLYPVDKKDYNTDPYIKGQWDSLADRLEIAERVTVFGYSAPISDVEAIDLLSEAWGNVEDRAMEEFELIDIRSEDDVRNAWNRFIHTHHYHYCTDYFKSSLALHPRRTVESYRHWAMPLSPGEMFQEGNKIPDSFQTLEELWEWHLPLIKAEEEFYNNAE